MPQGAPRFAADAMLGALARWLRLLGYDTTYERDVPDERLVQVARSQGRVVVTRDRAVARRAAACLLVERHDLDGQLAEVFAYLGRPVPETIALVRCSMCNAELVRAGPDTARGAGVPPRVLESQKDYWRCPGCARIYWRGTHVASMERRLAALARREPGDRLGPRNG